MLTWGLRILEHDYMFLKVFFDNLVSVTYGVTSARSVFLRRNNHNCVFFSKSNTLETHENA